VFVQLKRRLYILSCKLRLKLKNIPPFIMACCVLHNLAKMINMPYHPSVWTTMKRRTVLKVTSARVETRAVQTRTTRGPKEGRT